MAYANDMIKNDSGKPVQYFNDINGVNYAHFCGKEWGIGDIAVFNDLVRNDVTHKIDGSVRIIILRLISIRNI